MKNDENTQENKKELLKVKKKYSIKYVLVVKLIEVYVVFLLVISAAFLYRLVSIGIVSFLILIAIIIVALILSKKSASQTYISFYDDKVFYKRKFLFIDTERTLEYSEIKDIVFTQGTTWYTRMWQKIFGYGNIYIYPKKGNIITHGMTVEVVENIDKVVKDIKTVIGDKIK